MKQTVENIEWSNLNEQLVVDWHGDSIVWKLRPLSTCFAALKTQKHKTLTLVT
jgi:hypothetical protein